MAWQKTPPQQQHQRPSQEQNPSPGGQGPARPARLAQQQQGAEQCGEEQQIEQVLRLIRHLQHDLADMRTAFHEPMRRGRFGQREGLENARPRLARFQHWPDFGGERCRDLPLLRRGAGAHGAAGHSQALDHDRAQISFRLESA